MRKLHELSKRCNLQMGETIEEAAVRSVASSVPGLKWEVEKDPDKGGAYRVRLMHQPSGKLLWSVISDVIAEPELASSLKVLDRIWGDTNINWNVPQDEPMKTPNIGSAVSGASRRADNAKKEIKANADVGGGLLGKQVKFQERLQSALRKGEVREADTENNHG